MKIMQRSLIPILLFLTLVAIAAAVLAVDLVMEVVLALVVMRQPDPILFAI